MEPPETDAALDSTTESQYNVLDATLSSQQRTGLPKPKTAGSFRNAETATSSHQNTAHGMMKPYQSAQPIDSFEDSNYYKFLQFFPEELQEDNIDILIINASNDQAAALEFKSHLEKDIIVYVNKTSLRPRVKLLEEFRKGSSHLHLDFAFEKTLYVFLFVTKDFCECTWTLLQGQACLTEAIHDPDKKWCVIPVHTKSRRNMNYKLPMMLGSLRPINYWKDNADQFYTECVRKLIDSKLSLLVQRDQVLEERRKEYFFKNKEIIMKQNDDLQARLTNTQIPVSISVAKESEPMDNNINKVKKLTLNSDDTSTSRDSKPFTLQHFKELKNVDVNHSKKTGPSTVLAEEVIQQKNSTSDSVGAASISSLHSSSEFMTSSITVDCSPSVVECDDSMASTGHSVGISPSVTQCKNISMPSNSNSITTDGPSSSCTNSSPPTSGQGEARSMQTQSVYQNNPAASSMPLNLSSSCIMGPNGIMYTPTPFGYLPVIPAMQHVNTNVCQNTTKSDGSALYETLSQSASSSLNFSMQPNVSEPYLSHNIQNVPVSFSPFFNPFSGFYMPSFPALGTRYGNPSLPPQGIWSQPNQQNQLPQETMGQPNSLNQPGSQTSASSGDKKNFHHSQTPSQVDGTGDAKYTPPSSSGSVQHIHHHHYQIEIEGATNVVVGENAKVFNNLDSSTAAEKFDDFSGPSSVEDKNNIFTSSDSSQGVQPNNTQTPTSRLGQSVPSADCNQESSKSPNQSPNEFMGFPECPDPCSVPNSTDIPNSQLSWNSGETTPKKIV